MHDLVSARARARNHDLEDLAVSCFVLGLIGRGTLQLTQDSYNSYLRGRVSS
jgi:hypothetical protein